jgi:hypothetical protein
MSDIFATRPVRPALRAAIACCSAALISLLTVVHSMPAEASVTQAKVCRERGTPYNWTQASCVEWVYGKLLGTAEINLGPKFSRPNVARCTLYMQLKPRTYPGPLRESVPLDCTDVIKTEPNPIELPFPDVPVDWGYGRRSGDVYQQYVWIDILSVSGAKYYSRSYYADVTTTKP